MAATNTNTNTNTTSSNTIHPPRPCRACTDDQELFNTMQQKLFQLATVEKSNTAGVYSNISNTHSNNTNINNTNNTNFNLSTILTSFQQHTLLPCPPDRIRIGRSSWSLLHTIAAYYPAMNPTIKQQQAMKSLIYSISELYPCTDCAEHLKQYLIENPINNNNTNVSNNNTKLSTNNNSNNTKNSSNTTNNKTTTTATTTINPLTNKFTISKYFCDLHNSVNSRLNKPIFNCSLVLQRWAGLDQNGNEIENLQCDQREYADVDQLESSTAESATTE